MNNEKEVKPSLSKTVIGLLKQMRSYDVTESNTAFQEMCLLDREQVMDILTSLLTQQDTELRCQAADTLVKIDAQRGIRIVIPFLETSDATLRWVICGLLSNHGDVQTVSPLIKVLRTDSEADVRMMAAFALGKIGDRQVIPPLQWAQEHDKGTDFEGRRVSDVAVDAIQEVLARHPD